MKMEAFSLDQYEKQDFKNESFENRFEYLKKIVKKVAYEDAILNKKDFFLALNLLKIDFDNDLIYETLDEVELQEFNQKILREARLLLLEDDFSNYIKDLKNSSLDENYRKEIIERLDSLIFQYYEDKSEEKYSDVINYVKNIYNILNPSETKRVEKKQSPKKEKQRREKKKNIYKYFALENNSLLEQSKEHVFHVFTASGFFKKIEGKWEINEKYFVILKSILELDEEIDLLNGIEDYFKSIYVYEAVKNMDPEFLKILEYLLKLRRKYSADIIKYSKETEAMRSSGFFDLAINLAPLLKDSKQYEFYTLLRGEDDEVMDKEEKIQEYLYELVKVLKQAFDKKKLKAFKRFSKEQLVNLETVLSKLNLLSNFYDFGISKREVESIYRAITSIRRKKFGYR